MAQLSKMSFFLALALAAGGLALADEHDQHGHGNGRPEAHGEPHPGPRGYERPAEPHGWNTRPATVDRHAYEHNFQAARQYHIGVYRRPHGWVAHRWAYGEVLPRAYWAAPYLLADYCVFD